MENIITFQNLLHPEHPLQLIDMQPQYPHYEEEYDDRDNNDDDDDDGEDNLSTNWDFHQSCNHCGKVINLYHRYYYKCSKGSCDYRLHKFCGEMPKELKHRSHRANDHHNLTFVTEFLDKCEICRDFKYRVLGYWCHKCYVGIHVKCIIRQEENHPLYHPSHQHPLVSVSSKPTLCECDACGKEHKGVFYHCITCLGFSINRDCAFLPKTLRIPHDQHTHRLTLAYSFLKIDQHSRMFPRCRKCGGKFKNENLWIYKCEKCRYYVHLNCATSIGDSSFGTGKIVKNYEDADHPGLVNLPFPDQTHDILQHLFRKESGHRSIATNEGNLINHIGHQHMLTMQCDEDIAPSFSSTNLISCHNPMKKIELLCNGCIRPIMNNMPFYKCTKQNDEGCTFVVHEWCTRLPPKLLGYPSHPHHELIFLPKVDAMFNIINVFQCAVCGFVCNGFGYGCVKCDYYVDVNCAFIPEKISHEAHAGHLLSRVRSRGLVECFACKDSRLFCAFLFGCRTCGLYLHPECALLSPSTIIHWLDKHPLKLKYLPVENHKGQYFCEICEEELDPKCWFYHCDVCVQSIHPACSSVIIDCERAVQDLYQPGVFKFLNIKFGGTYSGLSHHSHSLSLAQGINRDGRCTRCSRELVNEMIFKCLECKFVADYYCMSR